MKDFYSHETDEKLVPTLYANHTYFDFNQHK